MFEIFGKDNSMRKLVSDYLELNAMYWNYRKIKKRKVMVPLLISAFYRSKQPYFDWRDIFNSRPPETQKVIFFTPIIIQLYCCPSEPSKDF
jgi:hypothetical protein